MITKFWDMSMKNIIIFILIIIYSIIILSSSNALLATNFADVVIPLFGIWVPSVSMLNLIIYLKTIKSANSYFVRTYYSIKTTKEIYDKNGKKIKIEND